jgi:arylamine N-acetyltransferase
MNYFIRAYAAAARVNGAPAGSPYSYGPLTHTIILTQPSSDSNETYLVDVGFGSSCITSPILLSNHPNNINIGSSETERHRLTRSPRPDSSLCKPFNHQERFD